jgi:hypothetical protein
MEERNYLLGGLVEATQNGLNQKGGGYDRHSKMVCAVCFSIGDYVANKCRNIPWVLRSHSGSYEGIILLRCNILYSGKS